jgi:hypothetical protein
MIYRKPPHGYGVGDQTFSLVACTLWSHAHAARYDMQVGPTHHSLLFSSFNRTHEYGWVSSTACKEIEDRPGRELVGAWPTCWACARLPRAPTGRRGTPGRATPRKVTSGRAGAQGCTGGTPRRARAATPGARGYTTGGHAAAEGVQGAQQAGHGHQERRGVRENRRELDGKGVSPPWTRAWVSGMGSGEVDGEDGRSDACGLRWRFRLACCCVIAAGTARSTTARPDTVGWATNCVGEKIGARAVLDLRHWTCALIAEGAVLGR